MPGKYDRRDGLLFRQESSSKQCTGYGFVWGNTTFMHNGGGLWDGNPITTIKDLSELVIGVIRTNQEVYPCPETIENLRGCIFSHPDYKKFCYGSRWLPDRTELGLSDHELTEFWIHLVKLM